MTEPLVGWKCRWKLGPPNVELDMKQRNSEWNEAKLKRFFKTLSRVLWWKLTSINYIIIKILIFFKKVFLLSLSEFRNVFGVPIRKMLPPFFHVDSYVLQQLWRMVAPNWSWSVWNPNLRAFWMWATLQNGFNLIEFIMIMSRGLILFRQRWPRGPP